MSSKLIVQYFQSKDKGTVKFYTTLILLLSLTFFVLEANTQQPDSVLGINASDSSSPSPYTVGLTPTAVSVEAEVIEAQSAAGAADSTKMLALARPALSSRAGKFPSSAENITYTYTIQSGDTFSHILEKHGDYAVIRKLMRSNASLALFDSLAVGREISFMRKHGVLLEISYRVSSSQHYVIQRQEDGSYKIIREMLQIKSDNAANTAKAKAGGSANTAKAKAGAANTAKAKASSAANTAKAKASSAANTAKAKASSAANTAKAKAGSAANTAKDAKPATDITYTYKIRRGDTLSHILEKHGHYAVIRKLLNNDVELGPFNALTAGRKIVFTKRNGVLTEISYQTSPLQNYKIKHKQDGHYEIGKETLEIEQLETHATVEIADSLYLSAKKMGMSTRLVLAIANILEWDIDFTYDVRSGDYFSVIYYENYVKDKKIGDGSILALHFANNGKDYLVIRYTDAEDHSDYYFLDGRKVRKAFLRSPLDFAYVSSHFSPRRLHPVLHTIRAHKGVDYAAKIGTPVRATGDGRIATRRNYNGYGNTVTLHHGGGYSTLYAHLSHFNAKQRVGTWVKQGQVIGYVGSSGLSTGPHLHYEFRVNGVHKNPLTVKLPDAKPLEKSEMPRFRRQIKPIVEKLNLLNDTYIASKSSLSP